MLPRLPTSWKFSLNLSKFCQAPLNVFLFKFLPFRLSRWYLGLLGKIYFFLKRQEKELIQLTIRQVFGSTLELKSLKVLIRHTFRGIVDHYHEKLFVAYSNFPRLIKFLQERVKLTGEDELKAALAEGRGIILVTGHYGAVEFLPGALAVRGYPATMICRFQTSRLRKSLMERAQAVGLQLVDSEGGNVLLSAVKALKQGRILITECDEFDEWRPGPGRLVSFLNRYLEGDRTLEVLQKRAGAPVVTALLQRTGKKSYTLHLSRLPQDPTAQEACGEACLRVLEDAIRATPEQWYQWKKFGKMLNLTARNQHDYQESGYLAPEVGVSLPVQT